MGPPNSRHTSTQGLANRQKGGFNLPRKAHMLQKDPLQTLGQESIYKCITCILRSSEALGTQTPKLRACFDTEERGRNILPDLEMAKS